MKKEGKSQTRQAFQFIYKLIYQKSHFRLQRNVDC